MSANEVERTHESARALLTPLEVADELRVSKGTIYRLMRAGAIDAVRVGGQLRVSRGTVDRVQREGATA